MAKTTTVRKDLIPYRAGVVVVTPLDANKRPDYTKSVATEYDFLTSTQTSVTRTTETLANGNGSDKEYITDETYNLAVVGNTFNPVFHAAVTGRIETLPEKTLIPEQFTWSLPTSVTEGATLEITFGTDADYATLPAADADGNYNFIINDSYGNTLVRLTDDQTLEKGGYKYDSGTKALQFSNDYLGAQIRVIFWYEDANSIKYDSNPILQQPEYQIQTFGIFQSAGTDDKYKVVTTLKRATTTGDVSDQTSQKSKSAPLTYNFRSTPVPEGVSVYSQVFTPIGGETAAINNVVNGVDDKFTATQPGG